MDVDYKNRVSDIVLADYLATSGAVLIEGAKWCGKTTSGLHFSKSVLLMHEPEMKEQNLQLAETMPRRLLQGETPRLIDEWQIAPKLWDAVRFEVDQRNNLGQFILTGSAVPADFSKIFHSGIGRIARLKMRPMSLWESGESSGEVSLERLFGGNAEIFGNNVNDLEKIAFLICRGGWPRSIGQNEKVALQQAKLYFNALVETDISRVDNVNRSSDFAKRLLRSYARGIGTQMKNLAILEDLSVNESVSPVENTLLSYLEALKKVFVVEESLSWNPNLRSKTAIRTSNTRYFVDPSIATAALRIGPKDLVNDLNTMGLFFENLCVRDLRVYANALDGDVYHYRDKNGLECDAVIHLNNGKYGLVEIKLGGDKQIDEAVKTLTKIESIIDTKKMGVPAFKMVLTAVGNYAFRRPDGIFVVPVGCLKN